MRGGHDGQAKPVERVGPGSGKCRLGPQLGCPHGDMPGQASEGRGDRVENERMGTFSTRFNELVGMPPSAYRRQATVAAAGIPSCVAKQVTRPVRNREARVTEPQLA